MRDQTQVRRVARLRKMLATTILLGWTASLLLPALTMTFDGETPRTLSGWEVLTIGFYAIAAWQFGWLANLALAAVLIGLSTSVERRWLLLSAIALLATTLDSLDLALRPDFHQHRGFGLGFYLWFTFNMAAALAALFFASKRQFVR